MSEQPPQTPNEDSAWQQHVDEALAVSQPSFTSEAAAHAQQLDAAKQPQTPNNIKPKASKTETAVVAGIAIVAAGALGAGFAYGIGAQADKVHDQNQKWSHEYPNPQLDNGAITDKDNSIAIYNPTPTPSPNDTTTLTSPNKSQVILPPSQITPSSAPPLPSPETH